MRDDRQEVRAEVVSHRDAGLPTSLMSALFLAASRLPRLCADFLPQLSNPSLSPIHVPDSRPRFNQFTIYPRDLPQVGAFDPPKHFILMRRYRGEIALSQALPILLSYHGNHVKTSESLAHSSLAPSVQSSFRPERRMDRNLFIPPPLRSQ